MAITATSFSAVRDLLAAKLREIPGLTVFDNPVRDASPLPSVEILWPRFERTRVDAPEPQLGSVGLTTYWTLTLRVDPDDPAVAAADSFSMLGLLIAKFDANETLGTTAADGFSVLCRVTDGNVEDDPVAGDSKPSRGYLLTLEVRQLL